MSTHSSRKPRRRRWYIPVLIGVILLGLASRRYAGLFPPVFGKYPGDVLWALMVYVGWGVLLPRGSPGMLLGLTLIFSAGVEVAKLCQAPWLVHLRSTTAGHLVFGAVFSWSNLVAYTVGAGLGFAVEQWLAKAVPSQR